MLSRNLQTKYQNSNTSRQIKRTPNYKKKLTQILKKMEMLTLTGSQETCGLNIKILVSQSSKKSSRYSTPKN
jgi:hypothetical protein